MRDVSEPHLREAEDQFSDTQDLPRMQFILDDTDQLLPKTNLPSQDLGALIKQSFLGKLFSAFPIHLLALEPPSRIVYANPSFVDFFGFPDITGADYCSLFTHKKHAEKVEKIIKSIFETDKAWVIQAPLTLAGYKRQVRCRLIPMRLVSKQMLIAALQDITAESKFHTFSRKYEKLTDGMPMGLCEFCLNSPVPIKRNAELFVSSILKSHIVLSNKIFRELCPGFVDDTLIPCTFESVFGHDSFIRKLLHDWHESGSTPTTVTMEAGDNKGEAKQFESTLIADCPGDILQGFWLFAKEVSPPEPISVFAGDGKMFTAPDPCPVYNLPNDLAHDNGDKPLSNNETNEALKIIIAGIEDQKKILEKRICDKVKAVTQPLLDHLRAEASTQKMTDMIGLLETKLNDLSAGFHPALLRKGHLLTLRELRICELVVSGLTSKEIAKIMGVSPQTIFFHRSNIRKKLGLTGSAGDLSSYLREEVANHDLPQTDQTKSRPS